MFAIISASTRKAQKDNKGNPHFYEDEPTALRICEEMNQKAAKINGVREGDPIPQLFRVVPW